MPAKKHKPEEIIGKLREVEIMLGQGGMSCCRFRGHRDKVFLELEDGDATTEVQP